MSQNKYSSTFHPVFDRFVEYHHLSQTEVRSQPGLSAKHIQMAKVAAMAHNATLSHCQKVILVESAVAMIEDIMSSLKDYEIPPECADFQPGPTPVWIEIDAPQAPPFYEMLGVNVRGAFLDNVYTQENLEAVKKNIPHAQHTLVESVFEHFHGQRDFDLIGEDGTVLFGFCYHAQQPHWSIPEEHHCPYGLCEEEQGLNRQPCQRCQLALSLFSDWLPLVWVSLQGAFRKEDGEVFVHQARRREQRPDNRKKKHMVNVEHRYHVVRTIDISVKPPRSVHDDDEQNVSPDPRGSWIKKAEAIDPNLVYRDVRTIPERERTLTHPRYAKYIEKHGTNKIKVKEHTKSFPMLSDPERVTRAKAKRYERKEDQPS